MSRLPCCLAGPRSIRADSRRRHGPHPAASRAAPPAVARALRVDRLPRRSRRPTSRPRSFRSRPAARSRPPHPAWQPESHGTGRPVRGEIRQPPQPVAVAVGACREQDPSTARRFTRLSSGSTRRSTNPCFSSLSTMPSRSTPRTESPGELAHRSRLVEDAKGPRLLVGEPKGLGGRGQVLLPEQERNSRRAGSSSDGSARCRSTRCPQGFRLGCHRRPGARCVESRPAGRRRPRCPTGGPPRLRAPPDPRSC